jgi:hypothetical protein
MDLISSEILHSLSTVPGLLSIYNDTKYAHRDTNKIVDLIKVVAIHLDDQTMEISDCIHEARVKL